MDPASADANAALAASNAAVTAAASISSSLTASGHEISYGSEIESMCEQERLSSVESKKTKPTTVQCKYSFSTYLTYSGGISMGDGKSSSNKVLLWLINSSMKNLKYTRLHLCYNGYVIRSNSIFTS